MISLIQNEDKWPNIVEQTLVSIWLKYTGCRYLFTDADAVKRDFYFKETFAKYLIIDTFQSLMLN